MKNLFLIIGTLCTLSGVAKAEFFPRAKLSELTSINTDKNFYPGEKFNSGSIQLNLAMKTVTLTLIREFHCPKGNYCAQVMPAPVFITLPVKSVSFDSCGSKLITAIEDARPVDGIYQSLEISDNSSNKCETLMPLAPVTAVYETEFYTRVGQGKTTSTFEGSAFQAQIMN